MALIAGGRPTAALVVGLALLQALWIVTLPPFAASDEFEHAYRAAGVAAGEFRLEKPAVDGRGELTEVPASLVAAASAQCDSLRYTGHDNCFPVRDVGDGRVLVATAAGSYNPAFYFVIGTAAEPFSGAGSLYVMRIAASLLCLLLIGAAAWLQRRRGSWTRLGLVVSLTPTLVYTTAVGAPNGAEIAAGILLWIALLELASHEPPEHELAAFWLAVGAASVLVTLRLLGPLFLVVIVACVGVLGTKRVWGRVRHRPRHLIAGGSVLLVAGLLSAAWILSAGQLSGGDPSIASLSEPSTSAAASASADGETWGPATVFSWMLQALAAFPYRNNLVPLPVYMVLGTLVVALVAGGLLESRGRIRLSLVFALTATLVIPVLLTAATQSSQGDIWQGRYILPLGVGFVLLAGRAIDTTSDAVPRWVLALIGSALAGSVIVGLLMVRRDELKSPPSVSDPSWWAPSPVLVVAVVLVATLALVLSAARVELPQAEQLVEPEEVAS